MLSSAYGDPVVLWASHLLCGLGTVPGKVKGGLGSCDQPAAAARFRSRCGLSGGLGKGADGRAAANPTLPALLAMVQGASNTHFPPAPHSVSYRAWGSLSPHPRLILQSTSGLTNPRGGHLTLPEPLPGWWPSGNASRGQFGLLVLKRAWGIEALGTRYSRGHRTQGLGRGPQASQGQRQGTPDYDRP